MHNQIITTTIMKEEPVETQTWVETVELVPEEMLETLATLAQEPVDHHLHENKSRTNSDILQKKRNFHNDNV